VNALQLAPEVEPALRAHGEREYPFEACGFLVGPAAAAAPRGPRLILRALPATNAQEGPRERRFLIRPDEVRRLEASLEASGEAILGFYHSHPDHPARPSLVDAEHAWPWYAYVVLRVNRNGSAEMGAFELDPERRRFEPLTIEPHDSPVRPPTKRSDEGRRSIL
jgi:proteasome lid subunit RPN8/RPN11